MIIKNVKKNRHLFINNFISYLHKNQILLKDSLIHIKLIILFRQI